MKNDIKNIIKVASTYSASVIGAGFASGQEILQFFTNYFRGGFYGIVLAGLLFSSIGYIVLDRVYNEKIKNFDEFFSVSRRNIVSKIINVVIIIFVLSVFSIMIAGMSRIIEESISISFGYAVVLIAIICMIFLINNIKGITAVSTVLTPLLVMGMLIIGIYIIAFEDLAVFRLFEENKSISDNWFVSSILYVSYNSIMSIVVMCSLLPYLSKRKVGRLGSIFGGIILCLIALIINTVIYKFLPQSALYEVPMVAISKRFSKFLNVVYTSILWLAMFVSAITSGFCFVERISSFIKLKQRIIAILLCMLVIPISFAGFSGLIKTVYPFFGYIGLLLIFIILFRCFFAGIYDKMTKRIT